MSPFRIALALLIALGLNAAAAQDCNSFLAAGLTQKQLFELADLFEELFPPVGVMGENHNPVFSSSVWQSRIDGLEAQTGLNKQEIMSAIRPFVRRDRLNPLHQIVRANQHVIQRQKRTVDENAADVCSRHPTIKKYLLNKFGPDCEAITKDHLAKVEHLNFSMDSLAGLSRKDLRGLVNLKSFNVIGVELDLPEDLFWETPNLEIIGLQSIVGVVLSPRLLSGLKKLQRLEMRYSGIQEIPLVFFKDQNSLSDLILTGNLLTTLPLDMLDSLPSLKVLSLGDNPIVEIPKALIKKRQQPLAVYLWDLYERRLKCNYFQKLRLRQLGVRLEINYTYAP